MIEILTRGLTADIGQVTNVMLGLNDNRNGIFLKTSDKPENAAKNLLIHERRPDRDYSVFREITNIDK